MKWWIKLFVCVLLLGGAVMAAAALKALKKAPERVEQDDNLPVVEAIQANAAEVDLILPSQGLVVAERETRMAAEVAGPVVWVSPKFENGGEFVAGEEMLKIDPSDYEASLVLARADLADARVNLVNEQAQSDRALRDWRELGKGGKPNDLVLRKPQLESAKARIAAAEANVSKANRDLERTVIRAPYDARVSSILTDLGTYLTPGAPVAELFSVGPFEIRLPLSLDDFSLLGSGKGKKGPRAWLTCEAGGKTYRWDAEIIRREGEVDRQSRSVYLVARIDPGAGDPGLLQPGLFMQAEVEGRRLDRVFRIPLRAFRDNGQLVLVGENSRLKFRSVEVVRQEGDEALVISGLNQGDRVVLTELEFVIDGMEVKLQEKAGAPSSPATPETLAKP